MICSGVCLRRAIVMILPSPTIVGNGLSSRVDRFQGSGQPDAEAAITVRREAHGLVANEIYEVSEHS